MPSTEDGSRSSIALVGPGAIGGTLAAWLAEVPTNDVTLCARTAFDRLVVEVPGGRSLERALPVLVDPSAAAPVDWVIAVTKTYDTPGAIRWLERLVGPATRVALVQNGVEHRRRLPESLVPADRLLPVIIDIPAERSAPGRIKQHRHGAITAPASALGDAFARLFTRTELEVTRSPDFLTAIWRKLTLNSAGVIQALTLRPASVVREPKAAALMRGIAREAVAVGRAVGAKLEDALVEDVLARLERSAPTSKNSLLVDREEGRPIEIDARNGVIVRLGAEHGIATPLNAMAVALLELALPLRADLSRPSRHEP